MAEGAKSGLLDLEKELTCSICTEILYQPLTLLDCLHTFCGSCLKEWFSWQSAQASHNKPNPYSCPSCRASVRETRPDAKVTTLLEMFLQANPSKGKTADEKEEMRKKYKVGDEVMSKIKLKRETSADVEDRRMVEEVREMSLREAGVRDTRAYERGTRHRQRDDNRDGRDDEARRRRREQERRRRHGDQASADQHRGRPARDADSRSQARHIEHQSSLRSLISNSDVDSAEMEAEILRQIIDEGLLDGIDLNNLDTSQEDELSERIADAYRRRHGQNMRSNDSRREESSESNTAQSDQERPRHRDQHRSPPAQQVTQSSHPPISRPHLFEAYPTADVHRRRTSSEHRRRTSPAPSISASRASDDTSRQAARSATDLSDRSRATPTFRARPAENVRRTSGHRRQQSADSIPRNTSHSRQASTSSTAGTQGQQASTWAGERAGHETLQQNNSAPTVARLDEPAVAAERTPIGHEGQAPYPLNELSSTAESASIPNSSRLAANPYMDTFVSCNRCGKANIAYDLHHNCSTCENGRYSLCDRCYRLGKGCLYWFGFGRAAMHKYERQTPPGGYPPNHPLPHVLRSRRYLDPQIELRLSSGPRHTIPDPAKRLESGLFCSTCFAFANECFWKCESCNDGEWGFCNPCVNQGKCCTHPLLPAAHSSVASKGDRSPNASPHSSFAPAPSGNHRSTESEITPLTFTTACDICTYPIPPSTTRFHCPQCNNGDYDICTLCYVKLVSSNRIPKEKGDKGWRKCPHNHRMIVVGFEDSSFGQRRIVVRDLVGGHAMKDDQPTSELIGQLEQRREEWRWRDEGTLKSAPASHHTPSHSPSLGNSSSPSDLAYPPSGGVGLAAVALWSYWPQEDAQDELGFPRGAEIRESLDINGDWLWGVYCGKGGLWPGGYARVLRR